MTEEIFDYYLYYPQEDVLVIYSYEQHTLRTDTFYGFEYGTKDLDMNQEFWSIQWDELSTIRHKVLFSDYTYEEYIQKFPSDQRIYSLDYTLKEFYEILFE